MWLPHLDADELAWVLARTGAADGSALDLVARALLRGNDLGVAAGRAALDRLPVEVAARAETAPVPHRVSPAGPAGAGRLVAAPVRHHRPARPVPARRRPAGTGVRAGPLDVALGAWRDGRLDHAVRAARRALDASAPPGTDRERTRAVLAVLLADAGRLTEACDVARPGPVEPPDRRREQVLAAVTARRLLAEGRLDEAVRAARCCLRAAGGPDRDLLAPAALSTVATATLRRGDLAGTTALLRSRPLDGVPAALTSRLSWLAGQVTEAREGPVRAVEQLAGLYDAATAHRLLLAQEPGAAGWLVRTALAAGHRGRAEAVAAATARLATDDPGAPAVAVSAAHARGLLDDERAGLHQAIAGHRDGWARATAAEDLAVATGGRPGSERELVALLDGALADYRGCGAERDAARVRSRLRAVGVRRAHWQRRDRPASGWDSLTGTERAVARLVTEGLTNRQIGGRMFLSPHTVSFHLRQVFRKLDIDSRVDLARLTLGHPAPAAGPALSRPVRPGGGVRRRRSRAG